MEYIIDRIAIEDDVFLIKDESKQDLLISGTNIKTVNNESLLGSGNIDLTPPHTHNIIEITYSELRSLRDNKSLATGQYYRITDYVTTCAEHGNHYSTVNTYSAGHQFDIIVMALSEDKLDENVSAVLHDGDTYFADCAISQWKIDYTIDNDTEKFRWASPDGKGVIYYMEDEHGNACTYDFKNIQYDVPSMSILGTNWKHDTSLYDTYTIGFEQGKRYYTFSFLNDSGEIEDASMLYVSKTNAYAHNNVIKRPNDWGYLRDLPVIVLLSLPLTHSVLIKYDYNYSGRNISTNKFDEGCEFIFMIAPCERTCFKPMCRYNLISPSSMINYFGDNSRGNFIDNISGPNTIGNNLLNNKIGSGFQSNTIGENFRENTVGNFFQSNTIDTDFRNNTIGDDFYCNSVGSMFYGNKLGNAYQNNTFGTYYVNNILSLDSDRTSLLNNCVGCKFDDNVYTNIFYPKSPYDNTSDRIQNVHVCRGICGTSSSFNYVEFQHKNSESEITITKTSDNNVVEHCVSDWCLGNKTKQSINLVNGFNWISFYVNTTLEELQSSLGDKGLFIRVSIDGSPDNYLQNTYDSQTGTWSGDITELDFTTSYIISVSEDCTIEVSGNLLDPEEYIITLNPGWNYIGFPLDCEFDFINDLDILTPSDDDTINTFRDGFVVFNTTMFGGWLGQFTTLKPGMGYRYLNNSNETKYITFSKSYKSSNTILKVLKSKQDELVDSENIKTINGESLLGEGNITIRDFDFNVKSINRGGYSLEAPENTIPAYILSKKKGFTYVEGDVSFTSDNIAVLLRDTTIDRTSNGSGSISSYTYKKVAQYDFGSWKSEEYTETRIPTFKEWILCCRNLGLHPYIRLNSENGYTLSQINQIVNEVKECGMQGKVTYISFDNTHLGYIRNAEPYARLGVMTDSDDTLKISQAKYLKNELNEVFINAQLSSLTPTFLSALIEEGIPLEVWIVNTPDEIIGLPPYVSGITSDNLIAGKVLFEESSVYNYGLLLYIATQLLSLDKTSLEFSNKDIKTLTAAIYPEDATEPVLWSTSDDSVAIVDNNGNVTPIDDGTCIITATSDGINAQCDVNVSFIRFNITKTIQGGTFENNSNSVIIGETYIDSIVANPGFTLNRAIVSITMGGIDITSSSYDNGKITIEDINGEVEINVQCTELSQIGDSFTLDVSRLDEAILY